MFFSKNSPFVLFSLIGATIISFTVQTVSSVPVCVRVYVCACICTVLSPSFIRRHYLPYLPFSFKRNTVVHYAQI